MKIIKTEDNSSTLFSERFKEHYHSTFGAVNESQHIFIDAGLKSLAKVEISIFEMGFGTGLNALLSLNYAKANSIKINYHTIEKYPVSKDVYEKLSFSKDESFIKLHSSKWGVNIQLSDSFILNKQEVGLQDFEHKIFYDLVYFDAFSPDIQPELWTEEVFRNLYNHMNNGAVLMTYSVKGIVKRALKASGFTIEKLPGPIGKREILKATKIIKNND